MTLKVNNFEIGANFELAVALGIVQGFSSVTISGTKTEVSLTLGSMTDIGQDYVFPPDSGQLLEVVSDNVGDDSLITVLGLDVNGVEKFEEVTVNGTTPVPLSGLWSRINSSVNTGSSNFAGTVITRTLGGAGNTYSLINPVSQISQDGVYSVPLGKRLSIISGITSMTKNSGSNTSVMAGFSSRSRGGVFLTPFFIALQRDGTTSEKLENEFPFPLEALSDVRLVVEAKAAGNSVLTRLSTLLIDDAKV